MPKVVLVILFSWSLQSWSYSLDDIDLSDYEFNRYVRPQLISISQDYQSLTLQINPELAPIKPFFNIFRKLISEKQSIIKYCFKKDVNLDCQKSLEESIEQINVGLPLIHKKIKFAATENLNPDEIVEALASQSQFFNNFNSLHLKSQNLYFLYLARTEKPLDFRGLITEIEMSYLLFSDFILKSSDHRFNSEFKAFWSDFIKPVKLIILPTNNKDLFIQKINDFNLRLNFLNVVLTKRSHPISKQARTLVKIIHNRWNNILKVTLKRQR